MKIVLLYYWMVIKRRTVVSHTYSPCTNVTNSRMAVHTCRLIGSTALSWRIHWLKFYHRNQASEDCKTVPVPEITRHATYLIRIWNQSQAARSLSLLITIFWLTITTFSCQQCFSLQIADGLLSKYSLILMTPQIPLDRTRTSFVRDNSH